MKLIDKLISKKGVTILLGICCFLMILLTESRVEVRYWRNRVDENRTACELRIDNLYEAADTITKERDKAEGAAKYWEELYLDAEFLDCLPKD